MKIKINIIAKLLEAIGISALMIGLVQGIYGDMWADLYFFLGGIAVFIIGRYIEKGQQKRNITYTM